MTPKETSTIAIINPCTNPQQCEETSENIWEVVEVSSKDVSKNNNNNETFKGQKWVKFEDEIKAERFKEENLKEIK